MKTVTNILKLKFQNELEGIFKFRLFYCGIMAFSSLFLTGCIETTRPLCSTQTLVDVPGFDGKHRVSMIDGSFKVESKEFELQKKGKGKYSVPNSADVISTCSFGSLIISETKTEFNTYKQSVIKSNPGQGFSYAQLIVGIQTLEDLKVSYQIVERDKGTMWAKYSDKLGSAYSQNEKEKILIIQNDTPESNLILKKYSVPNGVGFIYQ